MRLGVPEFEVDRVIHALYQMKKLDVDVLERAADMR